MILALQLAMWIEEKRGCIGKYKDKIVRIDDYDGFGNFKVYWLLGKEFLWVNATELKLLEITSPALRD